MIETRVHASIRFALRVLLVCGFVGMPRCASDLTDSLEGRACDENENCLPGYECDVEKNICVARRDSDFDDTDISVESGVDSEVEGDAEQRVDSRVNAEVDSGFDSGSDVGKADSSGPIVDGGAESDLDTSVETSTVNADSGDTASQVDAGTDARPCGFEIDPPNPDCPTECDDCSVGVCIFNCDDEQDCSGDRITCPEGFACDVRCSSKQACENARIDCPSIYRCNVSCTAEQSCKSTHMKCGEDGPCALNCVSGTQTCQDAELQCKNQSCEASCGSDQIAPNIKNCHTSCTPQCGC